MELQNQLELARQESTRMISKSEYEQLRTKLETTMAENKSLRNQISEMQNDK